MPVAVWFLVFVPALPQARLKSNPSRMNSFDIDAVNRAFERRRREWIDQMRKTDPTFAPDIESRKELLPADELAEVLEYESLHYQSAAVDAQYKPYKLTSMQWKRLHELAKKFRHIFYQIPS